MDRQERIHMSAGPAAGQKQADLFDVPVPHDLPSNSKH